MDEKKKKITIVTVCMILLIGMVVGLVLLGLNKDKPEIQEVSASQKAITNICQTTDYQEACVESLKSAGNDTSDPKKLIEVAFESAMKQIKEAAKNSTAIEALQKDPMAKAALKNCRELADRAVRDLQRTFDKFSAFDITHFDNMLSDLKIWLSGAITYQETCLGGFEGVPGDAGEKMRDTLKMAMQMTSNGLAMVAEIATFLESLGTNTVTSRRLLSERLPIVGHSADLPDWMDFNKRKLLAAPLDQLKPNLVVAKDGSGKFRTINEALKAIPRNSNNTFVLHIKEGVYEENVHIEHTLTKLLMIGDGPTKTRITGKLNFKDGTSTFQTATVAVDGDHFVARDIGFENTAGPEKEQAVALRVSADLVVFYNCHMDGHQDTLYAHTYRQFYKDCVISGTIDFIFGDSAAVFQGCTLLIRKPLKGQDNIVTAQGRTNLRQPTGFVVQNCTFQAHHEFHHERKQFKSYLGRPWREFSRTIIMESFLDDLIHPHGWVPWSGNKTFALETLFYTEFNNRGPASPKAERVKWPGVKELPPNRIKRFTASEFIDANRWVQPTNVPYDAGFMFSVPDEDPNIRYSPVVPEEDKDLGAERDKSSYVALIDNPSPEAGNETSTEAPPSDNPSSPSPISSLAPPPSQDSNSAPAPVLTGLVSLAPSSYGDLGSTPVQTSSEAPSPSHDGSSLTSPVVEAPSPSHEASSDSIPTQEALSPCHEASSDSSPSQEAVSPAHDSSSASSPSQTGLEPPSPSPASNLAPVPVSDIAAPPQSSDSVADGSSALSPDSQPVESNKLSVLKPFIPFFRRL